MKMTRGFAGMSDRYAYDFGRCPSSKGWAQLDTKQDASYYGNWINPLTKELFSFCEGDTTHIYCETDEEFANKVREDIAWHNERGYGPALIDAMTNPTIAESFQKLGLGDLLH
jgi:hypothetical protein